MTKALVRTRLSLMSKTMFDVGTRVSLNSLVCNCDGTVTAITSDRIVRVRWDGETRDHAVLVKNIRPAQAVA